MGYGYSLGAAALFKSQSLRLVCQPEHSPLQARKPNSNKLYKVMKKIHLSNWEVKVKVGFKGSLIQWFSLITQSQGQSISASPPVKWLLPRACVHYGCKMAAPCN